MSLARTVADLVVKAGQAHADELLPACPGYSRQQVLAALQNAASQGLIHCAARRSLGRGRGTSPGVFVPGPAGKRPARFVPVNSVWDYAQRRA